MEPNGRDLAMLHRSESFGQGSIHVGAHEPSRPHGDGCIAKTFLSKDGPPF
jgi:hypothetical protein